MPGMVEGGQGGLLLLFITPKCHLNMRVMAIGADVHLGYLHFRQPGVVQFKSDDLGQLFPNRLRDPRCSSFVHKTAISFQPSANAVRGLADN